VDHPFNARDEEAQVICKCGHDHTEHFDGKHNCMRQCDCLRVTNPNEPDPLPPRPNHAMHCRCARCKVHLDARRAFPRTLDDDEEPAPSTQRIWPVWP